MHRHGAHAHAVRPARGEDDGCSTRAASACRTSSSRGTPTGRCSARRSSCGARPTTSRPPIERMRARRHAQVRPDRGADAHAAAARRGDRARRARSSSPARLVDCGRESDRGRETGGREGNAARPLRRRGLSRTYRPGPYFWVELPDRGHQDEKGLAATSRSPPRRPSGRSSASPRGSATPRSSARSPSSRSATRSQVEEPKGSLPPA